MTFVSYDLQDERSPAGLVKDMENPGHGVFEAVVGMIAQGQGKSL
jgi:hypothetical protein